MKSLIDFLNHGLLPFTGREREIEHLIEFWRETVNAQGLRAALLTGETGSGKSRLIEEVIPKVTEMGGVVLHVKIFPESDRSIFSLISRALWYAEEARRLLRNQPEEEMQSVVESLRRLSRLRPTLLIVEDIHLLGGDSIPEFSTLLNTIAEETLSILCVVRPATLEARPTLERFLLEELTLTGFPLDSLELLWHQLFNQIPEERILAILHEETGGNPMALRSALRWSVKTGMLRDQSEGEWRLTVSERSFQQGLRQSIRLLAEGMIAHLTESEKQGAIRLAPLGEAIARETARHLLGREADILDRLLYKGVLSESPVALSPFPGRESECPLLVFTHTLLHEHLLSIPPEPGAILEVIAGEFPLYSYRPFLLTGIHSAARSCGVDNLKQGMRRFMRVAQQLDLSPDWRKAIEIWRGGAAMFQEAKDQLHPIQQVEWELEIAIWQLTIMRREVQSEEFRNRVEEFERTLAQHNDGALRHYRLAALLFRHRTLFQNDYPACLKVWREACQLLESFPELRISGFYVSYLQDMINAAGKEGDDGTMREIEEKWKNLVADPDLSDADRKHIRRKAGPASLMLFASREELEERNALLEELEREGLDDNALYNVRKLIFLYNTGQMEKTLNVARKALRRFAGVEPITTFQCEVVRICALLALGEEPERVAATAHALCAQAPPTLAQRFRRLAAIYLAEMGALRGELRWTERVIHALYPEAKEYWLEVMLLCALEKGEDIASILHTLPEDEEVQQMLGMLARRVAGKKWDEALDHAAVKLLERPILQLDDLLLLHAVLSLINHLSTEEVVRLRPLAREAFDRGFEWLGEHSLPSLMSPLLERHQFLFGKKELTVLRASLRKLEEGRGTRGKSDRTVQITMLGTITVINTDGEVHAVRGARQKTMLGLLVAAQIVKEPISNIEFCRIASGGEMDIDLARKTTNMAVARLRETFGPDFIETGDETHRLNPHLVRVDLLQVIDGLKEARQGLRNRALIKGVPALAAALNTLGAEVAFPGLYDSFFEALREDLETRLRSLLLDMARTLLHEEDAVTAEELLHRGFERFPDDEEIAKLLQESLRGKENRADAERVRLAITSALLE